MQKTVVRNPNQSPIRRNLLNIAGITVQGETITPQNGDRLLGGYGVAWLNNQDAASQTTGQDNPLPECNCESGGGDGGDDYPFAPCGECATLSESVDIMASGNNPCCIKDGQDCSTGTQIPVCVSERCGGTYGQGCTPPPYGECGTILVIPNATAVGSETGIFLAKFENIEKALEEGLQKAIDLGTDYFSSQGCTAASQEIVRTATAAITCNGVFKEFQYTSQVRISLTGCMHTVFLAGVQFSQNGGTQTQYEKALANWEKPSGKYLRNGKFYDACGLEPQDCITVCDSNGVPYEICTDLNGKPKIQQKET